MRGKGRPFLGICVGMQLMAERGREYEVTDGLGWIAGEVDKIAPADPALKIPHMGWNTLDARKPHPLLDGIPLGPAGPARLFRALLPAQAAETARDLVAQADYGGPVTAIVGARQHGRHAIPSGKEPATRACADRQFPEVEAVSGGSSDAERWEYVDNGRWRSGMSESSAVILFPAIDLKDGLPCAWSRATWRARPCSTAIRPRRRTPSRRQGFEYLHVVDLDGAFAGKPVNARGGRAHPRRPSSMPVQLGGGIRDMATIEGWLGKGVNRVIIGTAAVRDPALVKEAARKFPERVAVGLDARDGKVAVEGWAETSELTALDIARRFEDAGVAAIIYTDIARDGMLKGLNLDATIALAEAMSIPVIASGGLASIDDVKALLEPRAHKLEGAIAGRALYDGRLDAGRSAGLIRAARGGRA